MKKHPRLTRSLLVTLVAFLLCSGLAAQVQDLSHSDPKQRMKAADKLGDTKDSEYIAPLRKLLKDPVPEVRGRAIAAIVSIGTQHSLEPLAEASRDSIPAIQLMAVDGMVNFYYPGYVKRGFSASLKKFGSSVKNRFAQPSEVVIDPYVPVSPDVIGAVGRLISGGVTLESRANAARAAGILRGKAAIPQLKEALRSKDSVLILESVRSIEKIGDTSAGPGLTFLLRDLDDKVQLAVVKAVGQLLVKEAVPELVGLVKTSDNKKIRRQSLIALAKIPDSAQRTTFLLYLRDGDHQIRAAAAEGIGRAGDPQDLKVISEAFAKEKNESARLSMAFTSVYLGDVSHLSYLTDGLNSTFHRMEARPFLVELARKPDVLNRLYELVAAGTNDQKRHLAYVLSISGTQESVSHLEKLTHDPETNVAQAAIEAMKALQARL
jgi:HEAT repeat protein